MLSELLPYHFGKATFCFVWHEEGGVIFYTMIAVDDYLEYSQLTSKIHKKTGQNKQEKIFF